MMNTKEHYHHIIDQFQKRRVVVIGEIGVDKYIFGSVNRISPEAPVPVVEVIYEKETLGLASNVASNVTSLGAEVVLIGLVGEDLAGKSLRSLLKDKNISDDALLTELKRSTLTKTRIIAEHQHVVRIDYESRHPILHETNQAIIRRLKDIIESVDAIILEDYAKGLFSEALIQDIIGLAKQHGKPVNIDPNMNSPIQIYTNSSLLTPNKIEAEKLSGLSILSPEDYNHAAEFILSKIKCDELIITRGKDGMSIFTKDQQSHHIPTFAKEVYDVSGAGDTVIAALTLAKISGASTYDAAFIANHAAGIVVGKVGTAAVSASELKSQIENHFS